MLARAALSLPGYERQLRDLLAAIRPEIVHTNGFKAHVLCVGTRVEARATLWHMHEYISQRPLTRRLIRHYADRCSLIVANSESVGAGRADDHRQTGAASCDLQRCRSQRFSPRGAVADLDALAGLPPAAEGTVPSWPDRNIQPVEGPRHFLRAVASLPASVSYPTLHRRRRPLRHRRQPVFRDRAAPAGSDVRPCRPRRFHRVHRECRPGDASP